MKLHRERGQGRWGEENIKPLKLFRTFFPWKKKSFLEKAVNFFYTNLVKMTSVHSQIRTIKMKTSNAQTQTGPRGWETTHILGVQPRFQDAFPTKCLENASSL